MASLDRPEPTVFLNVRIPDRLDLKIEKLLLSLREERGIRLRKAELIAVLLERFMPATATDELEAALRGDAAPLRIRSRQDRT